MLWISRKEGRRVHSTVDFHGARRLGDIIVQSAWMGEAFQQKAESASACSECVHGERKRSRTADERADGRGMVLVAGLSLGIRNPVCRD